ncbi:type III effector protein [Trinickia terrae]|uniref:Type III effector protein n=1 Tax=Trinickia terrae TaxID=2571161 RepID=A0A4V5PGY6_9BURK|nr:YopJ family acetyltransferase [Trinickia terrae]TKC81320.1 type III effector protein [Trinickia terrae]
MVHIRSLSPTHSATPAADIDNRTAQAPRDESTSSTSRRPALGVPGLSTRRSAGAVPARRAAPVPASVPASASAPERAAGPVADAVANEPDIVGRIGEMKGYLAQLRTAHAEKREMVPARDAQFLDLLVAVENERDAALNLSAHRVDYKALSAGKAAGAGDLAKRAVTGMQTGGSWHAIVSMDGHEVALSARHDPERPMHVSAVVVDSTTGNFTPQDWGRLAMALGAHMNAALKRDGKPGDARVVINCLNTGVQKSNEGGAIFALAAMRDMPGEPDIASLHEQVLAGTAQWPGPFAARAVADNSLLGARFFKHMTLESNMQSLLAARPKLAEAPVNKKGETLAARQEARLGKHRPSFGLPYESSHSYATKRIHLYERALSRLEAAAAPQLLAARRDRLAARLDAMASYVLDLHRARKGKAAPPPSRDAEFTDLLVAGVNALDPQMRLSAHKIDVAQLAKRESGAVDSVSEALAEGMRNGGGWHAMLDLDGHHVALSARHDRDNPAHVSLAVLHGAGSPMSEEDWKSLAGLLGERLDESDPSSQGKLRLTRLDVSAIQPATGSALFALRAVKDMKTIDGIADLHIKTLADARNESEAVKTNGTSGVHLFDEEYDATANEHDANPLADPELLAEHIAMYRAALGHHERTLASMLRAG